MGELNGHMTHFSNWIVYDISSCKGESFKQICAKDILPNKDRVLNLYEEGRLRELQKWAFEFFGERSIRSVMWWSKMVKANVDDRKKSGMVRKGVDLILKTVEVDLEENFLEFVDQEGDQYTLCLKTTPVLKKHAVIKLRNVSIKFSKGKKYISLSSSSSCLIIPINFFDVKLFDPDFYAKNHDKIKYHSPRKIKRSGDFSTKRDILSKFPFLEDYYFEELLIGKKKLIKNPSKKKIECEQASMIHKMYVNRIPVYLSTLQKLSATKKEDALFQKMVTNVYIQNISETDYKKIVFKYCKKCQKVKGFYQTDNFECCNQLMGISLVLRLEVQDDSLEPEESFPFYITTKKSENDPFSLWNTLPNSLQYKKWSEISGEDFVDFRSKLDALKKFMGKIKFVVELKKTGKGRYFFEVCNTIFTP